MKYHHTDYAHETERRKIENRYIEERRKQSGVAFPSASKQEHLLIIRIDLETSYSQEGYKVRDGLRRLCMVFDNVVRGNILMDNLSENGDITPVNLSTFNFSFTLGFGIGFFEKMNIPAENRPRNLIAMPDNTVSGDPHQYTLPQTDLIIQLGATDDYVNRWVFQNSTSEEESSQHPLSIVRTSYKSSDEAIIEDHEIYSTLKDWARIIDVHSGFQRIDGRNLLGFNDGVSNPNRLSNDVIWTTAEDEAQKLTDGTYMVFQKIEHDLQKWRALSVKNQEQWIGRSKATGLLLGTLSKEKDSQLAKELHSEEPNTRRQAMRRWKKLYDEQKDPGKRFFDSSQTQYLNIQTSCPVWSHVRKANPREADGAARSIIFRRGYLFEEGGSEGKFTSGLLFICFQRNIARGFEYITKNFLKNKDFPVPTLRNFTREESTRRRQHGRFSPGELKRMQAQKPVSQYEKALEDSNNPDSQNTGREGLSGPSELGVYSQRQTSITISLGGGYYFVPPIPNKSIKDLSEQFFV
jgi:Dyp-type peroxidase family